MALMALQPVDDPRPRPAGTMSAMSVRFSLTRSAPFPSPRPGGRTLLTLTTAEPAGADDSQTALDAFAHADHGAILRRASLTVTHGKHGTMISALRQGVTMIVIPDFSHDQIQKAAADERGSSGRSRVGNLSDEAAAGGPIRLRPGRDAPAAP
jgi:hypothetical protein